MMLNPVPNGRHPHTTSHNGLPSAGKRVIATSVYKQDGKPAEQDNTISKISDARI